MVTRKIRVRAPHGHINPHYGKYRARVTIDGQTVQKTFDTEEQAQTFLIELCRRHSQGISLDKAKIAVGQLVDLFLEAKQSEGLKAPTLQSYRYNARYVTRFLGELPAQSLTPTHVTHLLTETRKLGHSVKYRRNHYTFLHAVLEYGISQEILERNAAARVKPPTWNRPAPRAWTSEQVDRFKRLIEGERLEAMWWVFLSTGLRVGELAALKMFRT